jgi:hypothetical protein
MTDILNRRDLKRCRVPALLGVLALGMAACAVADPAARSEAEAARSEAAAAKAQADQALGAAADAANRPATQVYEVHPAVPPPPLVAEDRSSVIIEHHDN